MDKPLMPLSRLLGAQAGLAAFHITEEACKQKARRDDALFAGRAMS
jgi:hypothetical protein